MARVLIIVARDRVELYDDLTDQAAGQERVQVILDRRHGARRQRLQVRDLERRQPDRRRQAANENDLRAHGFVGTRRVSAVTDQFRRFYEDLSIMTGEGVPVEVTVRKIKTAFPLKEEQQAILGHLRDTLEVYLASSNRSDGDKESGGFVREQLHRAHQLEKLIDALKKRSEE